MNRHNEKTQKISFDNIAIHLDESNIAWVSFDQQNSPVNVLTKAVFEDLEKVLDYLEREAPTGLVFLSNKSSGFIAGADISEFVGINDEMEVRSLVSRGQTMFTRIEKLPFPTLTLIHGFCLGGGFELSLACDYRVACEDEKPRIGLPEVLLGIHPGFGGSVRLIRLIGVLKAMPIMLTGRNIDGRRALKLGLVNQLVPRRHIRTAIIKIINKRPKKTQRGWTASLLNLSLLRPIIANQLRKQVSKKVNKKHYPAPFALIDLWQDYGSNDDLMMQAEEDSLATLFMHATAKNLVKVFLLQEQLKKVGTQKNSQGKKLFTHVHVIGAGIMGGDIAAWCALKGLTVTLQDREPKFIEPALARSNKLFFQRLKDPYARQAAFDRLIPDHKGYGIEKADIVIEAIIEDLDAKAALYKSLEPRLKESAILATNTSSIPLQELAAKLQRPERLIGLHFFNPVAKMKLVEIIYTKNSDPEHINAAADFTKQIERLPLPALSSPGFLVNRVLLPYLLEAIELFNEGVPAQLIDKAACDFGMPIGPIHLADTVGLDICYSVSNILSQSLTITIPDVLSRKVTAGKLGIKTGEGFYSYKNGKLIAKAVSNNSLLKQEEIQNRLILRLLNECIAVLREGVVESADMLDAGMIFGTGFAPFYGGPMHYLKNNQGGPEKFLQTLVNLENQYGERFKPDVGWDHLKSYYEK